MSEDERPFGHQEPQIVINGQLLTTAEAMTMRVALSTFFMELQSPDALGDDERGRAIQSGYAGACKAIFKKMEMK